VSRQDEIETVNARDLHAFLEVGKDFSTWIKDRILGSEMKSTAFVGRGSVTGSNVLFPSRPIKYRMSDPLPRFCYAASAS